MTIEAIVPIIVKALRKLPEPPWYVAGDDAPDTPHCKSGLALVDTGRTSDWSIARLCEWNTAEFIASSPLWLAQMVVGIVEQEVKLTHLTCIAWGNTYRRTHWVRGKRKPNPYYQWGEKEFLAKVLGNLSISSEDWEWLKGKVENGKK